MKYILIGFMGFMILMSLDTFALEVTEDIRGFTWMLLEAPDASDIHVRNYAIQINGTTSYEDCRVMLTTYSDDAHRWCAPIEYNIKPLDRSNVK